MKMDIDLTVQDIDLIYIGEHFYYESSTTMSSIYSKDGKRWDWGFVQIALGKGISIHIRPATKDEIKPYEERLSKIQAKRAEQPKEK